MGLAIDFRYGRSQPPEWETVLGQIHGMGDALALMSLFEYGNDETLFANDIPITALVTDALLLSMRGFGDFLAAHLHTVDGNHYAYTDFYSPTRARDAEQHEIDSLVERCRLAGVTLEKRPSPLPPWELAVAQIRDAIDARAFLAIHDDERWSANNWPVEMQDVDLRALVAIEPASGEPTAEEIADFVARCRHAGVILERD